MALFEPALLRTLQFEGRYSDNPSDPGGETVYGISRHHNPDWSGWKLVDRNKSDDGFPICLDDDRELQDEVKWLYRHEYWDRISGDKIINQNVANKFFDSVVNPGFVSIRFMQRALNEARSNDNSIYLKPYTLAVDGIMGNNTLEVLNAMHNDELIELLNTFKLYRIEYYKEHSKPEFLHGLIRRADEA